jgi:hypothetical protein
MDASQFTARLLVSMVAVLSLVASADPPAPVSPCEKTYSEIKRDLQGAGFGEVPKHIESQYRGCLRVEEQMNWNGTNDERSNQAKSYTLEMIRLTEQILGERPKPQ